MKQIARTLMLTGTFLAAAVPQVWANQCAHHLEGKPISKGTDLLMLFLMVSIVSVIYAMKSMKKEPVPEENKVETVPFDHPALENLRIGSNFESWARNQKP